MSLGNVGGTAEDDAQLPVLSAAQHLTSAAYQVDFQVGSVPIDSRSWLGFALGVIGDHPALGVRCGSIAIDGAPKPAVGTILDQLSVEVDVDKARVGRRRHQADLAAQRDSGR